MVEYNDFAVWRRLLRIGVARWYGRADPVPGGHRYDVFTSRFTTPLTGAKRALTEPILEPTQHKHGSEREDEPQDLSCSPQMALGPYFSAIFRAKTDDRSTFKVLSGLLRDGVEL